MNCILHILKDFPVALKFFSSEKEIFSCCSQEILSDELNLEIKDLNDLKINVYPQNTKKFLPYALKFINENEKLKLESKFAKLFSLPEENYILKLFPLSASSNEFEGNKIEVESGKIKRLCFMQDMAGRAKVEIFAPGEDCLCQTEEYYVYLNKEKRELQTDLVLLDFFEAIATNDFDYAKNLLSPKLSETLSKETIEQYFGKFDDCKIVNYYSNPSVVLFFKNEAKVFGASFLESKIVDIFEIN